MCHYHLKGDFMSLLDAIKAKRKADEPDDEKSTLRITEGGPFWRKKDSDKNIRQFSGTKGAFQHAKNKGVGQECKKQEREK